MTDPIIATRDLAIIATRDLAKTYGRGTKAVEAVRVSGRPRSFYSF